MYLASEKLGNYYLFRYRVLDIVFSGTEAEEICGRSGCVPLLTSRSPFSGTLYCRTLWDAVSVARRCILPILMMRYAVGGCRCYSTVLGVLHDGMPDAYSQYQYHRPSANTLPQQLTSSRQRAPRPILPNPGHETLSLSCSLSAQR